MNLQNVNIGCRRVTCLDVLVAVNLSGAPSVVVALPMIIWIVNGNCRWVSCLAARLAPANTLEGQDPWSLGANLPE